MKRIKDKKFLVELMLKTNLIIDAMCLSFNIESARYSTPNRIYLSKDNMECIEYDMIIPVTVEKDDFDRTITRKDKKHIEYVCKAVGEVREYVMMHMYDLNAPKIKNFTDVDKCFIEDKIDYLNEVFNEYKSTIRIETGSHYDVDITKYYREVL